MVTKPKDSQATTPRGVSLLHLTLISATRDTQTVLADGTPVEGLIEGVSIREVPTHTDERGSVVEIYDLRWGWRPDPLVFAHCFTIRPGIVKGWGLHKNHEDRFFILLGDMELVLFDPRPDSSTYGKVGKILLSESNRRLVNVPAFVWHAEHNIGTKDVMAIDFPTNPYYHEDPDKYRLPIDTPLIPYSFGNARGW
jgi:dTDP-4-dehydrorhamnose 3,5-epimerase